MFDDVTDEELKIVSASFCDPYLLILRHDSSVTILEATDTGDLEELERGDGLLASKWLSGCVYQPSGVREKSLAFLLSSEGALRVNRFRSFAGTSCANNFTSGI
jgi:cleavage and polyadenylation specificity factor subunit 1